MKLQYSTWKYLDKSLNSEDPTLPSTLALHRHYTAPLSQFKGPKLTIQEILFPSLTLLFPLHFLLHFLLFFLRFLLFLLHFFHFFLRFHLFLLHFLPFFLRFLLFLLSLTSVSSLWLRFQFLLTDFGFSLSNFTLSFFNNITVGCKYPTRPDLASHVWLLTSHPYERHMLLKGQEVELANGGKLSWRNSVGQLSFPSTM